jgi:The Golgi pH Regulator (GPHR) Family N-terminal/Abscisic acid G-protein coupled receptor
MDLFEKTDDVKNDSNPFLCRRSRIVATDSSICSFFSPLENDSEKRDRISSIMDVLLLTLSGAGTTYLSRQCWNSKKLSSSGHEILWTIAVGLSGLLFTFNLLELLPPSWFLWIQSNDGMQMNRQFYGFTLTEAYRIVMWSMAILCVIVIPSAMGIHLALYLSKRWKCLGTRIGDKDHPSDDDDADEKKKRSFLRDRPAPKHWIMRLGSALVSFSVLLLVRSVHSYVVRPIIKLCWTPSSHGKDNILPRTLSSESVHSQRRARERCCPNVYVWLRGLSDPTVRRCVLWGGVGGIVSACLLFMWISPFVIDTSNIKSKGVLIQVISWLCAVGVLLSTLLNGFGCVSLPYSCLAGFFLNPIPEDTIANAEKELEQLRADWKSKIQELESPDAVSMGGSASVSPPKRYFSWRRTRREFSDLGDAIRRRKATAMAQMEFLNTLVEEMSANVEEMRYVQTTSLQARTPMGRIKSWIGVFFSLLLLSRLYAALSNVGQHYVVVGLSSSHQNEGFEAGVDPISRVLLLLSGHQMMTTDHLHTLSQSISLILTAVLSASQIKVFLRVMTSIQRRMNHFYRRRWYCRPSGNRDLQEESKALGDSMLHDKNHIWFLSHPLSLLMCCYCVACTVLTKMMLPQEYRSHFSRALYDDDNHHAHPTVLSIRTGTVDLIYAGTALWSGLILAILLSILRSNVRRYSATCDGAYYQNQASKETV